MHFSCSSFQICDRIPPPPPICWSFTPFSWISQQSRHPAKWHPRRLMLRDTAWACLRFPAQSAALNYTTWFEIDTPNSKRQMSATLSVSESIWCIHYSGLCSKTRTSELHSGHEANTSNQHSVSLLLNKTVTFCFLSKYRRTGEQVR